MDFKFFQDTNWEVVKFGFQNLYELEYLRTYLEEAGGFKLLWVSIITFVPCYSHSSQFIYHSSYIISHSSQVQGDGSCCFTSIHGQMRFCDDEEQTGAYMNPTEQSMTFTAYRLRLFAVRLCTEYCLRVNTHIRPN